MKEWPTPAFVSLRTGRELYHVHRPAFAATAFNPHSNDTDSWRFSPFPGATGVAIASWYGALSAEGALYETVFRNVVASGRASVDRRTALAERVISHLVLQHDLKLIKLSGDGLMQLLLDASLTTGGPETYSKSRQVAHALHDQFDMVQGLVWRSRINNDEMSLVLYADRVSETFATVEGGYPLDRGRGLLMVMKAANRIGCAVT